MLQLEQEYLKRYFLVDAVQPVDDNARVDHPMMNTAQRLSCDTVNHAPAGMIAIRAAMDVGDNRQGNDQWYMPVKEDVSVMVR